MFPLMLAIPSWLTDWSSISLRSAANLLPQGSGLLHTGALLLTLALLEAVLSADNAVALASLVRHVEPACERQRILNLGLLIAVVLRIAAVAVAALVLNLPLVRLLGGAYLIWLAIDHFQSELSPYQTGATPSAQSVQSGVVMVLLVAGTDLAFSLDSVGAAVGVTDQLPLVMLAGIVGVLMLRLLAGWMLGWMERFANLQNAGYLTVLAVGLRLVGQVLAPALVPSEPLLVAMVLVLFTWGFSKTQAAEP